VIRQTHLIAVVVSFLIAGVVVGCGSGPGYIDERGGEEDDAATIEEITAPKGDRSAVGTAQEELVGFDEEVVSPPGQANVPAGFGEGSLWATGSHPNAGCDDVKGDSASAGSASASSQALCAVSGPTKTVLKRVDPRSGEVVAEIPLEDLNDLDTQVAFGAGSVWVTSGFYAVGPPPKKRGPGDIVIRIDPQTNRVVDRIPVDPPSALAFGHGSVWVSSGYFGTLSRIDPQTDEVVAKIRVGQGAVGIAADESSGAVWVGGVSLSDDERENEKLSRVDPETNRVVAEIPIPAAPMAFGADDVAVGEGAVWVSSADKLLKVDPQTNEVAGMVSVGAYYSQLVVNGGGVWAVGQGANEYWLVRVDPTTMHVVAAEDIGPYTMAPGLAAGGGYVWFKSGEGLARVSATSWQEQTTEEARCEGPRTIMMKGDFITTNDIPGCPNGGLFSGTDKSDALYGLKGEDEIHGLGSEDALYGGLGDDVIYGGPGDETWLSGDDGDDVIYGGEGNEKEMDGEGGDDVIHGGDGDDGDGEYEMSGGPGEDVLYGGDGNDFLNGTGDGGQRDKLYCGEGRDYYFADKNDYVDSCEINTSPPIF
jgi:streptogramin lyase